jgi:Ribbon-helix-helix domain
MSPITKKHQQLILLEPGKADLLEKLAAETRIPKQALLREAVDDLLAKHYKVQAEAYDDLRTVLTEARALANKIAARGHDEAATVKRAARILHLMDSVQQVFQRNWRFS